MHRTRWQCVLALLRTEGCLARMGHRLQLCKCVVERTRSDTLFSGLAASRNGQVRVSGRDLARAGRGAGEQTVQTMRCV